MVTGPSSNEAAEIPIFPLGQAKGLLLLSPELGAVDVRRERVALAQQDQSRSASGWIFSDCGPNERRVAGHAVCQPLPYRSTYVWSGVDVEFIPAASSRHSGR